MIPGQYTTRLLTPLEAAETLRISRAQVYRLMKSGELLFIKIGRRRLVLSAALEAFLEQKVRENA